MVHAGWILVAKGLDLKLLGMWILFCVPLAAGLLWAFEINPIWATVGLLGLSLLIDCVGRILCLRGRAVPGRQLAISTYVQISAIVFASILPVLGHDVRLLAIEVLWVLCLGQVVAASTFTGYLLQLTQALNRQDLMPYAVSLSATIPVSALSGFTLLIIASVTGLGCAVFVLFWFYLGAYFLLVAGVLVAIPFLVMWAVSTIKLFTNYGILIGRLRTAILFEVDKLR